MGVHSGGEGTVTVDTNVICSTGWEGTETAEWVDITTTCDYDATDGITYTRKKAVSREFAFSFEGFADDDEDSRPPLLIRAGDVTGAVELKLFDDEGVITMTAARVMSVKLASGGPKGVNSFSMQMEAQGKVVWIQEFPTP